MVVLEAEVCEARRGGEMRQEELPPTPRGAGWLLQASFGLDPTYSFKEGVTPNKAKLLSEARSAMQGLWPQWPPCPVVVAMKPSSSHPLLSSLVIFSCSSSFKADVRLLREGFLDPPV